MKLNRKIVILTALFIVVVSNGFGIFRGQKDRFTEPEYAENQIMVKFKPEIKLEKQTMGIGESGLKTFEALNHKFDATKIEKLKKSHLIVKNNKRRVEQWHKITFSKKSDIKKIVREYGKDPSVEYAQPDYKRYILFLPDDPYYSSSGSWGQSYGDMWGLEKLQMEQAWDITKGSSNIIIAVVDTGLDITHPEIIGNYVPGWNFCDDNDNVYDGEGHATHVSGIIAARGNNSEGIVGIAYNCKIMPVKAINDFGEGYDSDLAAAVIYAANNGARIINMSWGAEGYSWILDDALNYAYGKGCIMVASAGNSNDNVSGFYPASHPDVITVAATDQNDNRTWYSNGGSGLDISAPGGSSSDILSLRSGMTGDETYVVGGKYYRSMGTSMAAPYVSGVAALVLSVNPGLTNDHVKTILLVNTDDLGAPGRDDYYGYGRVNAYKSLQFNPSDTAPIIMHTPLSDRYTTTQYSVSASIEDFNYTISSATLYWNVNSTDTFNEYEMINSYDTYYSTIPGLPQGNTIFYYITATNTGNKTARAPETETYSFEILIDSTAPLIVHTPISDTPKTWGYLVSAEITDTPGVENAYLYWDITDSEPFNQVKMTVKSQSDVYVAMIPGQTLGTTVYYYLVSADINQNSTRLPDPGSFSFKIIEDTSPPSISFVTPSETFRIKKHRIKVRIADDNLVKSSTLYWNNTGSEPFNETLMYIVDDDIYAADIAEQKLGNTVYCYVITGDYDDNVQRGPPAGNYTINYRSPNEILLVNDSLENANTYYYTAALDANYFTYDIVNYPSDDIPDPYEMKLFDAVIWFAGEHLGNISADDADCLSEYLNLGGSLFITGPNIAYDLDGDDFLKDYLHAEYVGGTSMLDHINIKGMEDDITRRLSLTIYDQDTLDAALVNYYPDDINPVGAATVIFEYVFLIGLLSNQSTQPVKIPQDLHISNTAGICYENPVYRLVYLAFGFEGINGASNRELLMKNVLYWLKSLPPSWETKQLCSYPNPAIDDKITFVYYVETQSDSKIYVYNLAGELVKKLEANNQGRGIQTVEWDIREMAPGMYVYYINTTLPDNGNIRVGPRKLAINYR